MTQLRIAQRANEEGGLRPRLVPDGKKLRKGRRRKVNKLYTRQGRGYVSSRSEIGV